MFEKSHIPDLYKKLNQLGYLDFNRKFVWMPEMEWMPMEEVMNYKYDEDVTQEVLPFAFMGSGDPWVFIENGTSEPYIGRYYHPELDGEYCARNFEDVILLNIIEFAESAGISLDKNGAIKTIFETEEEVIDQMREYRKVYDGLLRPEYLEVIDYLSTLHFKECSFGNDRWLALLNSDDTDALIEQHLHFDKRGEPFMWYLKDREDGVSDGIIS